MTSYALSVGFDSKDLETISQTGEKVALIQEVPDGGCKVIWLTFTPFENNIVEWGSDYYLYASINPPQEGMPIQVLATTPQIAQPQSDYTFTSSGSFSSPTFDPGLQSNQYLINNQYPYAQQNAVTFGLAQSYLVNNSVKPSNIPPLNGVSVLANQRVTLFPQVKVLIFLIAGLEAGYVHDNVILPSGNANNVESLATELDFTTTPNISVMYSASSGKFVQN